MPSIKCPYCDVDISMEAVEIEDGCCPECGAVVAGGSMFDDEGLEDEFGPEEDEFDDEFEDEFDDDFDDGGMDFGEDEMIEEEFEEEEEEDDEDRE